MHIQGKVPKIQTWLLLRHNFSGDPIREMQGKVCHLSKHADVQAGFILNASRVASLHVPLQCVDQTRQMRTGVNGYIFQIEGHVGRFGE